MVAANLASNLAANLASNSGGTGVLTPPQILGANLKFRVVSTTAWSAGAWVDSIQSQSMAGTGTPTRVVDGANGRGIAAVLFNGVNQGYDLTATALSIAPIGSRPYSYAIARVVTDPGNSKIFAAYDAAAAVQEICSIGTAAAVLRADIAGSSVATGAPTQAAPCLFEAFLTAAGGVGTLARDGTTLGTNGAALLTVADLRRVCVGAALNSTLWGNSYVWEYGICLAEPSAAQRTALLNYSRAVYGTA